MDTDRDDRSVTIKLPPTHQNRQHYNTQMQMALNGGSTRVNNHGGHGNHPSGSQADMDGDERIEVQILQQDDNWGETTTAITGNTSVTDFSMEDMSRITKDMEESIGFNCARYIGSILAGIIGLFAFLSPIVMVVLPKIGIKEWTQKECGPECEGLFISFASKLLILLIGTWALFMRRVKATMPRVFIFRALILFLVFMLTFAFWLFYGVRIYDTAHDDYHSIVLYAVSLVDALLFIHYLAIILLEIRQLQPQYVIKMVRSPDGETRHYTCGQLSIQRMAVWCLEQYYKEYHVYNPYLEHMSRRTPKMPNFKFYDVDGQTQNTPATRSRAIFAAAARRRDTSHNDRFYEEQDYDRRVRKRKARLLTAAEEAFTHIKRLHEEQGPAIPMDPMEAAQAIFPSMARALQKYLRITRQQPRYTMESILNHLAECVSHDMSPKSFLERYMSQGPIIWNDKDHKATQTWVLICDQLLSRAVEDGTLFQLRQGEVSLLCSVRKLPHFNLTEEVIDP
jgi:vang-like